jgi:hypothetical protein
VSRSQAARDPVVLTRETAMTIRRHVHHVHSSWPSPYVGLIAAILFGAAVIGVFSMLVWLTR